MKRFLLGALLLLAAASLLPAQEPVSPPAAPALEPPETREMAPAPTNAPAAVPQETEKIEKGYAIQKMPMPAIPLGTVVQEYIGHRFYEEDLDSGGWGWVRLPNESWRHARWVAVQETPGVVVAPFRYKGSKTSDQNYEYRLTGYIAPYQVYDPHTDEMLDVFVLQNCVPIGRAKPLDQPSGPKTRHFRFKPKADGSNTSV